VRAALDELTPLYHDGGLFQIAMAQQDLNRAQIRARFEQMRGSVAA